jgi:hypothetical protein
MLFQIAEGDCGKVAIPPVVLGACSIFGAPLKRQLRSRRRVDGLSRTTLIRRKARSTYNSQELIEGVILRAVRAFCGDEESAFAFN